ncbi:MAB_1171c family putative transporter [Streptomyces sp. NPDC006197]|uniref:MAB_1171c family putative transporter n=1 Tax=Streptomyces sp. NPDC006197 TaxID=3156685 RepID=UPI0033A14093
MGAVNTFLVHLCAGAGLAAFLYRLPELVRRWVDPTLRALGVYFLATGLCFLVNVAWMRSAIADLLGYPEITTVMTHAAVVVFSAAQQVVLIHWSRPPEEAGPSARRRILAFQSVLLVLVCMYFLVDLHQLRVSADGTLLHGMREVENAAYMLLYLAVCAGGQVDVLRTCRRYAGIAHSRALRMGLVAVGVGAASLLSYCAIRGFQVVGTQLGWDMSPLEPFYWTFACVGSLLELFGLTVPSWGPATRLWWANYRSYLRLYPLWRAIYLEIPTVALEPPPPTGLRWMPPVRLEYKLYRRVIEILDGCVELRPYLTDRFCGPRGPAVTEDSPVDEALHLHRALHERATGAPIRLPRDDGSPLLTVNREAAFAEEVAWLVQVSTAFARVRRIP